MEQPNKPLNKDPFERYKQNRQLSQYTDIAMTMGVTIALGVFAGKKLDAMAGYHKPVFTLALTMLAIFASFYLTYQKITKKP